MPIGSGASASAGVIIASYGAVHATTRAPSAWSWQLAPQAVIESIACTCSHSAQLSALHVVVARARGRATIAREDDLRADQRAEDGGEHLEQPGSPDGGVDLLDARGRATRAARRRRAAALGALGRRRGVRQRRRRSRGRSAAGRGSRATASANGSAGGGAHDASPSSWPARTSSASAVSRDRARQHAVDAEELVADARAPSEIRPRWGLRPTRPQHAAGMRVEPPPSLACAIGTMPDATAAAAAARRAARRAVGVPRVARRRRSGGSRSTGRMPELGQRRRADDDEAGASRSRVTTLWSNGAMKSPMKSDANVSRLPATGGCS